MSDLKIKQGIIQPEGMRKRFGSYIERYGLSDYTDRMAPAVFFGCYRPGHIERLRRHQGLAVLVWLGTDIIMQGKNPFFRKRLPRLKHVAIGPWIERDLRKMGLSYRRLNLLGSPIIDNLRPVPKGDAVYCYLLEGKRDKYGGKIVDKVRAILPGVKFLIHGGKSLPHEQVPSLYSSCFMGLRLTRHDGCAETVTELGLMGRRCVYNGDHPNAIPWRGATDIAKSIQAEQEGIGSTDEITGTATRRFIETGRDWLILASWEGR